MITDYYGLSFNPFEKANVRGQDCFRSNDFRQAMHGMNYVAEHLGIGVFTARPGMGKSYALRCFARELRPGMYTLGYICLTSIMVRDFYRMFCEELKLDSTGTIPEMYRAIREQVAYLYREKKQPLILMVDECHLLAQNILRDMLLLMNVEFDSVNHFSLLLAGEPRFISTLKKPSNEAFSQRIVARYDFQGLSDEEAVQYVKHKIACAGATTSILEESALTALVSQAGGNPRVIDNVMTDALIIGEQREKKKIDQDVILAAVENRRL